MVPSLIRPHNEQPPARAAVSVVMIYLGFVATGTCMALPGSVLPALLTKWSMPDSQAGLLFFFAWIGTSIGALLVRPPVTRSLRTGHALITIAAFGMAFIAQRSPATAFAWMALFGVGLGMIMTATSLLQAARHAHRRGAELNRLNLFWAIGASVCPTLAEHSLRIMDVQSIFTGVAVFFLIQFVWVAVFETHTTTPPAGGSHLVYRLPGQWTLSLWPISLVMVICLPTGIEASMGGWIATYVQRTQHAISTTVTAGSCFWIGLMISRTLSSVLLASPEPTSGRTRGQFTESGVLRQSLVTVVAGIALLILSGTSLGILPGVFLIGFGLGPVYPLLLAIALQYSEKSAIFFVAGLGSACLPWLTGVISSATASLHTALLIPLSASLLMLVLGLRQAARPVPRELAQP